MPPLNPKIITEWNNPGAFASRHFTVGPLAYNRLLVVSTGVVVVNFRGDSPNNWTFDRLRVGLSPNVLGEAQAQGWLPNPPVNQQWSVQYNQRDIAPLVTLNALYNYDGADNDGKAVDAFNPLPYSQELGALSFDAYLAVRDSDAYLYRVGYQLTAIGQLVSYYPPN